MPQSPPTPGPGVPNEFLDIWNALEPLEQAGDIVRIGHAAPIILVSPPESMPFDIIKTASMVHARLIPQFGLADDAVGEKHHKLAYPDGTEIEVYWDRTAAEARFQWLTNP